MKMSGGPTSVNLKITLLVIAILIAGGTLFYTQNLVSKLQERERRIVELYANSFTYIASSDFVDTDLTFIFENIIKRIDFPLILTDANDEINISGIGGGVRNIEVDSTMPPDAQKKFLYDNLEELRQAHQPISVTYKDTVVLAKIYYGDSSLVKKLKYYPYLQIIFAFFFIMISYFSFSYLKRNEQSNIWVGMAKETAHQLGTPISSLMGWNELLKMNYDQPDKVLDASEEIDSDLSRLQKIAHRFSKIGSKPELKQKNVFELIEKVISYFQRRLPQTGRMVMLELDGEKLATAEINSELFEWVIENLIKNALDAIEHKDGKIVFHVSQSDKYIEIDVMDNGKGIDLKRRNDIFRPGYSTKRRGWGLGLSLSKRIVEDYHRGKIFVKSSVINEGTSFKIILKRASGGK